MKYLADDGTVFNNEDACRKYEETNVYSEMERVNALADALKSWLKHNDVEIGFHAISDGDDDNDVYLYSTTFEEAESKSLWDD